jgi:Transglutaminase-like superfamily
MKSLRKARRLTLQDWAPIFRAVAELAIVRLQLAVHSPRQVLTPEPIRVRRGSPGRPSHRAAQMINRVSWAIGVAGCRVPWRSDCLVKARAAQRWLAREGIPTQMFIGVRKDRGAFEAHAWLRHEGKTITGGDFSGYAPLVTPDLHEIGVLDRQPLARTRMLVGGVIVEDHVNDLAIGNVGPRRR